MDRVCAEVWREFAFETFQPEIPKAKVVDCMASEDIEAMGAVYYLLTGGAHVTRIQPSLMLDEAKDSFLAYYAHCFREDPDAEWADSRYTAGHGLMAWFKSMWYEEPAVPVSVFEEIKAWLADLYRNNDADVRLALVHACLEHLFEEKKIRKFFSDWKDDATLSEAYAEAVSWVEGLDKFGIDSPTRREID
jgi:hypothetical protein